MRLLAWTSSTPVRRRKSRTFGEAWARQRVAAALPLAVVGAWLARPTVAGLAGGAAISAVGLVVRGLAAGRLDKNETLATSGPYAVTRHPLYLGSTLVLVGLLVAAQSWMVAALGVAYLALFYPATIAREDRKLRARHGAAFDAWAARVPRFWPRLVSPRAIADGCSWARYRKSGEYRAVVALALGMALLSMKLQPAASAPPRMRTSTDLNAGVPERPSSRRGTSTLASG
jgi:protein-S-isoprenylcysteine O-methyltransferase Ste14